MTNDHPLTRRIEWWYVIAAAVFIALGAAVVWWNW